MTRNVLLICLDSVRKDYFDKYAPRLQNHANISFEQCRAASSWTTPSHASMFTGLLPHQHDVHTHNRSYSTLRRSDTFIADLPDKYTTIGISANVHAGPAFDFDTLFDRFSSVTAYNRFADGLDVKAFLNDCDASGVDLYREFLAAALRHDAPLKSLGNGISGKLQTVSQRLPVPRPWDDGAKRAAERSYDYLETVDEPFFLFMNLMDAHPPLQHTRGYDRELHNVPNSWSSTNFDYWEVRQNEDIEEYQTDIRHFKQLYSASIDYLDRVVRDLIRGVKARTTKETAAIVTADHGEDLGGTPEDRRFGHVGSLSEGLLHVPLLAFDPSRDAHSIEDDYVSHLDLGRLVTAMAEGNLPDITQETVPAEVIGGISQSADIPLDKSEYRYWNRMIRCVYRDERKVQWDSLGNATEYRIDRANSSFQEVVESDVTVPDWAKDCFRMDIEQYKKSARKRERSIDDQIGGAAKERLKDLGYL